MVYERTQNNIKIWNVLHNAISREKIMKLLGLTTQEIKIDMGLLSTDLPLETIEGREV